MLNSYCSHNFFSDFSKNQKPYKNYSFFIRFYTILTPINALTFLIFFIKRDPVFFRFTIAVYFTHSVRPVQLYGSVWIKGKTNAARAMFLRL